MRSAFRRLVTYNAAGFITGAVDCWRNDIPDNATAEEEQARMVPPGASDVTATATVSVDATLNPIGGLFQTADEISELDALCRIAGVKTQDDLAEMVEAVNAGRPVAAPVKARRDAAVGRL